jgi:hypothetical protein
MRGGGKTARQEPAAGKAGGPQYYLSAAEHQGEPVGHWVGEGLAWLGKQSAGRQSGRETTVWALAGHPGLGCGSATVCRLPRFIKPDL